MRINFNKEKSRIQRIRLVAGAIRIELISLVLETKAQPLYQTPKQRSYYITKKDVCQLFLRLKKGFFIKGVTFLKKREEYNEKASNIIYGRCVFG